MMINNAGQVCGQYMDKLTKVQMGFRLSHGKFSAFNVPNSTGIALNIITDNGGLSGTYLDTEQPPVAHGFIATPKHGHN